MNAYILIVLLLVSVNCYAGLFSGLIRNDISAVKSEIEKVDVKVNSNIKAVATLKAQVNANASGIAGVNNKINTQNAGRDIVTTTTNDTDLMKTIFKYWYGIFVLIIGFMKYQYGKIIKIIELEKKFYKDMFMSRSVKDDIELSEMRELQSKFVKSGGKHL